MIVPMLAYHLLLFSLTYTVRKITILRVGWIVTLGVFYENKIVSRFIGEVCFICSFHRSTKQINTLISITDLAF